MVTVVCANRSYAILKLEMARERITPRCGVWREGGQPGRWPAAPAHESDGPHPSTLPSECCSNGKAARALTDIGSPAIDWVALAAGMGVPASRASTAEELAAALTAGLQRSGPTLIEAVL